LGALKSASYKCGLDGGFDDYALRLWPELVRRDVKRVQRQFSGVEHRAVGPINCIKFDKISPWAVISHPLWDTVEPTGLLRNAIDSLDGEPFVIVDSFNLARRPVKIRQAVKECL
jgi:hypothetical protein